jgi:hypothetical protein
MVSIIGAVMIMLAAAAYGWLAWPWGVALGLALHMSWHVFDGADGDLARLRGGGSAQGELVDGICDYAGHIVLYVTLGFLASAQIGVAGWGLMWAAGASRVVQAAHYEGARRQYQQAVYATPWLASTSAADPAEARHPFVIYYLWLTGLIVPHGAALTSAMRDPEHHSAIGTAMRAGRGGWLAGMSLLSANYRTLAVGAAMLAGRPHWYFLFEVVALNVVLALSLRRVRAAFGAVLAQTVPASTRR